MTAALTIGLAALAVLMLLGVLSEQLWLLPICWVVWVWERVS